MKVKIEMTLNINKKAWLEDNADIDSDEASFVIAENCKELIITELSDYLL